MIYSLPKWKRSLEFAMICLGYMCELSPFRALYGKLYLLTLNTHAFFK